MLKIGLAIAILPNPSDAISNPYLPCFLTADWIEENLVDTGGDIHCSDTVLISLENTMNGNIYPFHELLAIKKLAQKKNLSMHLDGARLWNATAATNIEMRQFGQIFDTISLCLSKGNKEF